MHDSILSIAERRLFEELQRRGVRSMIVGMSGALLQGARGATEDIDLWFEDVADPQIGQAVRAAGGIWVSGSLGMGPPRVGGDALSERADVVLHMSGLRSFSEEYRDVVFEEVEGIRLPVLPLERITHSKRSAGRSKDQASLPALEDAFLLLTRKNHH